MRSVLILAGVMMVLAGCATEQKVATSAADWESLNGPSVCYIVNTNGAVSSLNCEVCPRAKNEGELSQILNNTRTNAELDSQLLLKHQSRAYIDLVERSALLRQLLTYDYCLEPYKKFLKADDPLVSILAKTPAHQQEYSELKLVLKEAAASK